MVNLDTSKLASDTQKATNASGWADVAAPVAPLEDHIVEQLGRVRNDAFAWMKYVPETGSRTMDNLPPQLREHLVTESDYAQQILDPLSPSNDVFFHSMSGHAHGVDRTPSVVMEGWTYQVETASGSGHKVFLRTHRDGRTEALVDESVRARGHVYYRTTDHQHSPDDRYFV